MDPLGVCNLKNLGYELLGPVGAIEKIVGHQQMELLDIVEVPGNVALCEVLPANFFLACCKGAHLV